jgi:superoxide dismutase, Fe-Mn family
MRSSEFLTESKEKLELAKLPYSRTALAPVMSKNTIDNHYGKLAKGYVDRYNKGEGDKTFNAAGAYLHNLFFPQLRAARTSNNPTGLIKTVIDRKFKTFDKFKEEIEEKAMKLQGSHWIYLSKTGTIKTIPNHQKRTDIALLIDWWEHAWALDYGTDKKKYLSNIWRIINWDIVNQRL